MQENERNAEEERRPQFEFMLLLALRMVPPTARQIVLHFERWYFKPFPHFHRLKSSGNPTRFNPIDGDPLFVVRGGGGFHQHFDREYLKGFIIV